LEEPSSVARPIEDDDYIPFEGPLWATRGPRKVSEAEAAQLQQALRKIRERQAERHRRNIESLEREALATGGIISHPNGPSTDQAASRGAVYRDRRL
jgi:hypothetical protein